MNRWTLVLSHARGGDPLAQHADSQLEKSLAECSPGRLLVTGDLYDMPGDDPLWEDLASAPGGLVVLSRYHPRALYWLLGARGVEGHRADQAEGEGRPIHCLDLRRHCCPDKVVEALAETTGAREGMKAKPKALRQVHTERWYPIVDYERCTGCLECLEFCLFGVYDRDDAGLPVAAEPDKCKPGCPACSRVCPAGAIMFPRYGSVEAIAGADTGEIPEFKVEDLDPSLIPAECADAVKERLGACGCGCADSTGPASAADCGCGPGSGAEACDCDCNAPGEDPVDRALDRLDREEL